jgi:hypothetical protein
VLGVEEEGGQAKLYLNPGGKPRRRES